MKKLFFAFAFFVLSFAMACPIGTVSLNPAQLKKLKAESKKLKPRRQVSSALELPDAASISPWGGSDHALWKPEAVLANAASYGLNHAWRKKNVADVRVSVPVKMIFTREHIYGDGQTNATLNFGAGWMQKHPQLVATLVTFKNGRREVSFQFSPELPMPSSQIELTSFVDGKKLSETLKVKRVQKAVLAVWKVPSGVVFGDDFTSRVTWVRIAGEKTSYPIDFKMAIHSQQELVRLSQNANTLGQNPLDFVKVFERAKANQELAQSILLNGDYGPEWFHVNGQVLLQNDSVHGRVGSDVTAVGGGNTWFVDQGKDSTFKNLYTCFAPRGYDHEKQFGVPSGGGWHEIGDAAETIINDLENAPVVVGMATGLPWATPPDDTTFAWGLSDIATIRLLQSGEALTTAAGDQTWKEDIPFRKNKDDSQRGLEASGGGRNYHWFIFNSDQPTCTQEWVHNCIPTASNDLGLNQQISDPKNCR